MSQIDGLFGGKLTFAFSSATTVTLTTTTATFTPGAGPDQSDNSLIKFTGTLTGTAIVQFTRPGFYIVDNRCTVGAFCVKLSPSAGLGNSIGAPPGRKCHVFYDGTDMDYCDMPEVGAFLDLCGVTAVPTWMNACTVAPYLIRDGTPNYSVATYPALGALLGSTFGGNGVTTFGVPDSLSRLDLPVDYTATRGRVTLAGCGINGTTMGSAGGSEFIGSHNHVASVTDPGHIHTSNDASAKTAGVSGGGSGWWNTTIGSNTSTATTGITVAVASSGAGASQNMIPAIVSFLPLIKT